jgi:hypothetical protein
MIRHKLPNKMKSATIAEPKLFHQLNKAIIFFMAMSKFYPLSRICGYHTHASSRSPHSKSTAPVPSSLRTRNPIQTIPRLAPISQDLVRDGRQDEGVRRRQPCVSTFPSRSMAIECLPNHGNGFRWFFLLCFWASCSKIFIGGLSKDTSMSTCGSPPDLAFSGFQFFLLSSPCIS